MPTCHQPSSQPLPYNERALLAMSVVPNSMQNATTDLNNSRVVIGFVDYGFDLLHPCLLDVTGAKTRFKFLWDQNRTPELVRQPHLSLSGVRDYAAVDLNRLIAAAQLSGDRTALDSVYDPHANYYGRTGVTGGAHGTQMVSMAAGTAYEGFQSPAPFADLIGVQLAVADTDWREETAAGEPTWHGAELGADEWDGWRTYDACPQTAHAIHYIYDRACRLGAKLVVINLSIGTWAGAHDGQSLVEQAIAKVMELGLSPGATACQVVIGAGNAGADRGHFSTSLTAGGTTSFEWRMNRHDSTQNKLEIWYDGPPLSIELKGGTANGPSLRLSVGVTHGVELGHHRVGIADHVIGARGSLSRVRILLHPPYMAAADGSGGDHFNWTLTVNNSAPASANQINTLHAWVERDDGLIERSWLLPHHVDSTLCCLATAPGATVVGGASHHTADGQLQTAPFSSRGPAPWLRPEANRSAGAHPSNVGALEQFALAPAYNIWGACSKSTGFVQTSGTSAAAALMSGVLASRYAAQHAESQIGARRVAGRSTDHTEVSKIRHGS
jgi:Subtilase family